MPEQGKRNATLKNTAMAAQAPINAASRTLRDMSDISMESVRKAAANPGCHKNLAAASLKNQSDAADHGDTLDPFAGSFIKDIEKACARCGYKLRFSSC